MTFSEKLNEYIAALGCTGKELAARSGLSDATISRYRSGERSPSRKGNHLHKLAAGIASLSTRLESGTLSEASVFGALSETLGDSVDFKVVTTNLNAAITFFGINISEMARFMRYDASHISRIRTGQRRPADTAAFIDGASRFIARYCADGDRFDSAAELIGCSADAADSEDDLFFALKDWLCSHSDGKRENADMFLRYLDDFDLDSYIRSIRFDQLKVPGPPVVLRTSKTYYGVEQMKAGELDFLRITALSRSTAPVFMFSDMPAEDMGTDHEFGKEWMSGIVLMLKRGLHLNIIHSVDRPFREMIRGLESWIPMYMTGQISPYYLQGTHNSVFCRLNYVSGSAALSGECISGSHGDGKYYLTNDQTEVAYFRKKADLILERARPLMDIFRQDSESVFTSFLGADSETGGERRCILSAPPLYTATDELLRRIAGRHGDSELSEKIVRNAAWQRSIVERVLESNHISAEVAHIPRGEFESSPVALSLSGLFCEKDITYTYEEYEEHLRLTAEFSASHPNYTAALSDSRAFRNIQITMHSGKWVLVSKGRSPSIHFVIRHPRLRGAIENISTPYME